MLSIAENGSYQSHCEEEGDDGDENCAPTTPTKKGGKRKNAKDWHQQFGKGDWNQMPI